MYEFEYLEIKNFSIVKLKKVAAPDPVTFQKIKIKVQKIKRQCP